MEDVAGKRVGTTDVGVDADGTLVLARDLDEGRQSQLLLVSHKRV